MRFKTITRRILDFRFYSVSRLRLVWILDWKAFSQPVQNPKSKIQNGILFGVCLLAACGGETRPDLQPMAFNIDPSQVEAPVEAVALGIRFQPPAGWMPLSAAVLDSIGQVLSAEALDLQPQYVYSHPANGSVLNVATIENTATLGEQVMRHGEALATKHPGAPVQQDQYLKDNIHIAQFLLQSGGYVTFTLFFASSKGGLIQFDYIVPQASYPEQIKAIESSIGSIQLVE